ncbi:MAG: hypothetical protein AAF560_16600 [Acidobacteriota bacterium]
MSQRNLLTFASIVAVLVAFAPASQATSLLANDDLVIVEFNQLNDRTIIDFSYLLWNDSGAAVDDVFISEEPLHRDTDNSGTVGTSYVFTPSASFWGLGSDQLTYSLTVQGVTSTATVFLFADLPTTSPMINEEFEPGTQPIFVTRSSGANTVGISTTSPISGAGSLEIDIVDALDGDAYISLPYHRGDDDDEDELGGCYRAGGGRSPAEEAEAWIMVLQGPTLDPDQAPVRLLRQSDGALVVEVQGDSEVASSQPVYPTNQVVHFKLLWSHRGNDLKALLRVDGMAVETPKVTSGPPEIDTAHIGGILAGDHGKLQIDLDLITGGSEGGGPVADRFFLEGFESGTLTGWNHIYGPGLEVGPASAISGGQGLESTVLSANFVSRAFPVAYNGLTVRFKVDARLLNLPAGRLITPVSLGSDSDPLFGTTDFSLALLGNAAGPRAGLSTFYTDPAQFATWTPLSGEHIVELQYRRSDLGADNGLLRLWIDGVEVATRVNLPDNLDLVLPEIRGTEALTWVHFGSKGFDPSAVSGALVFDDVSATRTE